MRVEAPENREFRKIMSATLYRKVGEKDDTDIFEGVFAVEFERKDLKMGKREFIAFCNRIKVDGGVLRRRGNAVYIGPRKTVCVAARLSADEYKMLRELAKNAEMSISSYLRSLILQVLVKTFEKPPATADFLS